MRDPGSVLRWVLLAIVCGSLGAFWWRRAQQPVNEAAAATPEVVAAANALARADVVVTYFTTDVRCKSCRTIESLAKQTIDTEFADAVAQGKVLYRVVNTDRPEHQHFIDRYSITNKTVIVSHQVGGVETEWTDRQDVWSLFHDPAKFAVYVSEPVRGYLAAK